MAGDLRGGLGRGAGVRTAGMTSAPTIGAIRTPYNGHLFRSRLEARWAVFFDALGIPYDYEPEAYSNGKIWYLPDFWLPDQGAFWEVKGIAGEDTDKIEMLALLTGKNVYVVSFPPWEYRDYDKGCVAYLTTKLSPERIEAERSNVPPDEWMHSDEEIAAGYEVWEDSPFFWCQCPKCRTWGVQYSAYGGRNCSCDVYEKADAGYDAVARAAEVARTHSFWEPRL
jgi:hypothetical protein